MASGSPSPSGLILESLTATPGSPARFTANALDDQGLPVSMAVVTKPNDATFDLNTGVFEWTPADRDLGTSQISLTAINSLGLTTTKTVNIKVVAARPALSSLRNGAGASAFAACSPGAFASLIGTSLSQAGSTGSARVFVNGTETSVIRASEDQVDFLCPAAIARHALCNFRKRGGSGLQRTFRGNAEDGSRIVIGGWLWLRGGHRNSLPWPRRLAALRPCSHAPNGWRRDHSFCDRD